MAVVAVAVAVEALALLHPEAAAVVAVVVPQGLLPAAVVMEVARTGLQVAAAITVQQTIPHRLMVGVIAQQPVVSELL